MSHLMHNYGRLPVAFARGEGPYLEDTHGNRYLDALSGIAVCGLGHAHPGVTRAISEQAAKLLHTSNLYEIPLQSQLADRLTAASGMDRAFFANSGAEANEAAIKLARLYAHSKQAIKKPHIVVMEDSFHGRTMATLTATGSRKAQAGFEPLLTGFVRAPFGDLAALEQIAGNRADVIAIMLEPILGEGGVIMPPADYLNAVRRLCDAKGWLMILDEVQTGNGRTGQFFNYQHYGIVPDIVTTAKGLGNGVPIGVCLARGELAELFQPGNHGSTFGGNPLACAAAHAVLDELLDGDLIARAASLGERLLNGFRQRLKGNNHVVDIRGQGLMIGIELADACGEIVSEALAQGLLLNVTRDNVVRLLPPLILTDAQADEIIETVSTLIEHRQTDSKGSAP